MTGDDGIGRWTKQNNVSTVLNRIPFSVAFQTKMQRILNKLTITGNCFVQAVAGHYSDPDLGKMILG